MVEITHRLVEGDPAARQPRREHEHARRGRHEPGAAVAPGQRHHEQGEQHERLAARQRRRRDRHAQHGAAARVGHLAEAQRGQQHERQAQRVDRLRAQRPVGGDQQRVDRGEPGRDQPGARAGDAAPDEPHDDDRAGPGEHADEVMPGRRAPAAPARSAPRGTDTAAACRPTRARRRWPGRGTAGCSPCRRPAGWPAGGTPARRRAAAWTSRAPARRPGAGRSRRPRRAPARGENLTTPAAAPTGPRARPRRARASASRRRGAGAARRSRATAATLTDDRRREQHEQRVAPARAPEHGDAAEREQRQQPVGHDARLLDAPLAALGEHHLAPRLVEVPHPQPAHRGDHRPARRRGRVA